MNRVTHFFLRAKHWQIFVPFFVLSAGRFVGMIAIMVGSPSSEPLGRAQLAGLGLLNGILAFAFLSYLWFAGAFLCFVAPKELKPRLSFFRLAIIYPVVLAFSAPAFVPGSSRLPFGLLVALGVFALICFIFDINFVSKRLVVAETGEPKVLGEYASTFFLLFFFFPIGVWFVQPRLNRLFNLNPVPD